MLPAHGPVLVPGCILACTAAPRGAHATGKRQREPARACARFGVLVQCLQTEGVPLSGRSVRVLFPAQACAGAAGIAAHEITEIVPETLVRLVASSRDARAADGSTPPGYDDAVRWLFEKERWAVHTHLDTLARLLVGRSRACIPPVDAISVLSVGEGTGVVTHIFHDVLASSICEAASGRPIRLHMHVRELPRVRALTEALIAQNAPSARAFVAGDVRDLRLGDVPWIDHVVLSIDCAELSFSSGVRDGHVHAEFTKPDHLHWNDTGESLIWCVLALAAVRAANPAVGFHFETTAHCRLSAREAVAACFAQIADAHCAIINCASLSAMRGQRFFVTSRELTLPTDADTDLAPTLSSVVLRRVNMGLAHDMELRAELNPTGDQLLRLIHGYYMSSMREGGHKGVRARRDARDSRAEGRSPDRHHSDDSHLGVGAVGEYSHPVRGRFAGYQCRVHVWRKRPDGSRVHHACLHVPMDASLMADILGLPSQWFVRLCCWPWSVVAKLISAAVPANVVLFVVRQTFERGAFARRVAEPVSRAAELTVSTCTKV